MLQVEPFTCTETTNLLAHRGLVKASPDLASELWTKTGGLPLAITLFCTLVANYGYEPDELLSGDLGTVERLRKWFDEINHLVTIDATKLLRLLSLVDGPFEMKLVKDLSSKMLPDSDSGSFYLLTRSFLVESYGQGRWKVHDLVASMCRGSLDKAVASAAHKVVGYYYNNNSGGWRKVSDDNSVQIKIKAFRHFFENGGMIHECARIVSLVVPEMKRRGYYHQINEIISPLRGRATDNWIDYHFAHSLLILRRVGDAVRAAEQLIHGNLSKDQNLRLAAYRLYAEAIKASGDPAFAESTLVEALEVSQGQRVHAVTRRQAEAVLVGLLVDNGKLDLALALATSCLTDAVADSDDRGAAVVTVRIGMIRLRKREFAQARKSFEDAVLLFETSRDQRGIAWALTNLSAALFGEGDEPEAYSKIKRASAIYDQLDLIETEYLQTVRDMSAQANYRELSTFLSEEIQSLALHRS